MRMNQMQMENTFRIVRQVTEVLSKSSKPMSSSAIDAWQLVLEDLEYEPVIKALTNWLKTQSFPPTPAEIRQIVLRERTDQLLDEHERTKAEANRPLPKPAKTNSDYMKQMAKLWVYSETHSLDDSMKYAKELGIDEHIRHADRNDPLHDRYFDQYGAAIFTLKAEEEQSDPLGPNPAF